MSEDRETLELIRQREEAAKIISQDLNRIGELKPTLISVMQQIRKVSGCEAIGIRLYDEGDYPYYVWDGFKEEFIKKENSLIARDAKGNRIMTPDGEAYELECMCGNVICSKVNPSKPFFTPKGSFWTNNTSALLVSQTEADLQGKTRNFCNICGYESVALIPIKNKSGIVGLIQLNDKRIGGFNREFIEYIEMLAEHIGIAIQNHFLQQKLEVAFNEIRKLQKMLGK